MTSSGAARHRELERCCLPYIGLSRLLRPAGGICAFSFFFLFHNHTTPTYKRRHTSYLLQILPQSQTSQAPNKATSQRIGDRKLLCSEHLRIASVSPCPSMRVSPHGSNIKKSRAVQEIPVLSLGQEDSLEKGMAIHSSILA